MTGDKTRFFVVVVTRMKIKTKFAYYSFIIYYYY